jgi:hypothetical protein
MPWRQHGRASVDAQNPRAFAVCDRCGFWYNHNKLQWQFEYSGPKLQNLRILVCNRCLDDHQPQLRPILLPQDPPPVMNPRVEQFKIDEA